MNSLFALLTLQAVMGAIDNLWHHELTERLPGKRSARLELSLHAAREGLYAFLFLALAWHAWHGGWAWVIGAVVIAEIAITLGDFIVEDRTRRLPGLERILHTLLAISIGAVLAALWPVLSGWASMPHGVVAVDHGLVSWMFTVFGLGAAAWSLRNGIAALNHFRPPRWVREPLERAAQATGRAVLVSGAISCGEATLSSYGRVMPIGRSIFSAPMSASSPISPSSADTRRCTPWYISPVRPFSASLGPRRDAVC